MQLVIDHYGQMSVEATAQSDTITVFVRSVPELLTNTTTSISMTQSWFLLGLRRPRRVPRLSQPLQRPLPAPRRKLPLRFRQQTRPCQRTRRCQQRRSLYPRGLPCQRQHRHLCRQLQQCRRQQRQPSSQSPEDQADAEVSDAESPTPAPSSGSDTAAEGSGLSLCTVPMFALALAGVVFRKRRYA